MKKVREGYKMTEIGEIPSDWNINLVKDITTEHKQGYYAKNDYNDNGTYLMRITDLRNQKINFKEMPRIEIDNDIYEQYKVELGDFLFARSGTIGRYGIYDREYYPQAVFASYIIRFRFNTNIVNNKYFGYFYESNYCLNQLKAITQGSSNININANNIKDLKICLPPLKEQERIASILSTVDEQIYNVDELIQKNKELKKGLMQQLLTKGIGHTRFKKTEIGEIPEEWEIKSIDEITKEVYRYPTYYGIEYVDKGIAEIRGELLNDDASIKKDSFRYISETTAKKFPRTKLEFGDIVISVRGTIGKVGYITEELAGSNITANLLRVSMNKSIMIEDFVKQLFLSDIMKKNFDKITTATTIKTFKVPELKQIILAIPAKDEQIKIASILSKLDEKIEEYENKKENLEELKKGLMQQLLMGKIRVCKGD